MSFNSSSSSSLSLDLEKNRFTDHDCVGSILAVFEEMKHSGGPLEPSSDYGVKEIRETLTRASSP